MDELYADMVSKGLVVAAFVDVINNLVESWRQEVEKMPLTVSNDGKARAITKCALELNTVVKAHLEAELAVLRARGGN